MGQFSVTILAVAGSILSGNQHHEACRQGKTTLYFRMPRLFGELAAARGDGSFERIFRKIVRADVLILDDWGPEQMTAGQRRDLIADAILDRLEHHAHRIELDGPSMRKNPPPDPVVETDEATQ